MCTRELRSLNKALFTAKKEEKLYTYASKSISELQLNEDQLQSSVRATDRHAADAGSIPRCGKRFFPSVKLSVQTLLGVSVHPTCAIACINICAHVKDPVVHVRVRWIMEILKHPVCTVGWVARLCRIWLSPGKATRISHWRNPIGTIKL